MDVIRAFAIIAVVLIHVSGIMMTGNNISSRTYNASMIINQIARFSVPAFILISGIGLTLSYKKEQGYFKFLGRRFNKIIPSYILWCLIYIY
ncbi:MAG: acyltransferase, partial [Clostridiaceae bacterium]|nr:acyltransferase [Clostridiaceae bacterium]